MITPVYMGCRIQRYGPRVRSCAFGDGSGEGVTPLPKTRIAQTSSPMPPHVRAVDQGHGGRRKRPGVTDGNQQDRNDECGLDANEPPRYRYVARAPEPCRCPASTVLSRPSVLLRQIERRQSTFSRLALPSFVTHASTSDQVVKSHSLAIRSVGRDLRMGNSPEADLDGRPDQAARPDVSDLGKTLKAPVRHDNHIERPSVEHGERACWPRWEDSPVLEAISPMHPPCWASSSANLTASLRSSGCLRGR